MSSLQNIQALAKTAAEILVAETPFSNESERVFEVRLKGTRVARQSLESVINEDYPTDYLIRTAVLLEQSGDLFLARTVYTFVLAKKDSRSIPALMGLGACHFKMGDIEAALKTFIQLNEADPSSQVTLWLARCWAEQGKEIIAIETLRRMERPEECGKEFAFEHQKLLGNCLTRVGRISEAETAFCLALQLKPQNDVVRVNLGMLELKRRNLNGARDSFLEASRCNSKNVKAINGLGLVAVGEGDWGRAEALFHQALDIDPRNTTAIAQLFSLTREGRPADLIVARTERLLELEPDNCEARYYLSFWQFFRKNQNTNGPKSFYRKSDRISKKEGASYDSSVD
ncbi:MAG: tetratricopeptide repeat protein [Deltaproteobacteria bacterium]|nr:tetratricopeptide repeat protein [Deltaproteobacteria bacterium]